MFSEKRKDVYYVSEGDILKALKKKESGKSFGLDRIALDPYKSGEIIR